MNQVIKKLFSKQFKYLLKLMPQNYTSLRFQLNPKEDPQFQRFQKELLKSSGRTALLTDTTIEQLNSNRPDGTPIFTGYQSRGYYKNDGSIPDYPNVPLATLNIKSRMENEATKEKNVSLNPSKVFKAAAGYNGKKWNISANWTGSSISTQGSLTPDNYKFSSGNIRLVVAHRFERHKKNNS